MGVTSCGTRRSGWSPRARRGTRSPHGRPGSEWRDRPRTRGTVCMSLSSLWATRRHAARGPLRRLTARVATMGVVTAGSTVAFAGAALAWHADVSAAVSCTGAVTYTATAWQTSDPTQRVNPDIGVGYSVGDVPITAWDADSGAFDEADNYSFDGGFAVPGATAGDVITVGTKALGQWSDGSTGQTATTTVTVPKCTGGNTVGSNGTVKVDGQPFDAGLGNEPHLDCPFALEFYGFDAGTNPADVAFHAQPPSGA